MNAVRIPIRIEYDKKKQKIEFKDKNYPVKDFIIIEFRRRVNDNIKVDVSFLSDK